MWRCAGGSPYLLCQPRKEPNLLIGHQHPSPAGWINGGPIFSGRNNPGTPEAWLWTLTDTFIKECQTNAVMSISVSLVYVVWWLPVKFPCDRQLRPSSYVFPNSLIVFIALIFFLFPMAMCTSVAHASLFVVPVCLDVRVPTSCNFPRFYISLCHSYSYSFSYHEWFFLERGTYCF